MLLFSPTISNRLKYVGEFIAKEMQCGSMSFTDSTEVFENYSGARINYSEKRITNEIWIKPFGGSNGFLSQATINEVETKCFTHEGMKAFFATSGDYPFDILSASFYLLSRYEEYLPHKKDEFGRYAHTNSLAFREGFLRTPLVNLWIKDLKGIMLKRWPEQFSKMEDRFTFLPTYDIDIAWSYLHKGFLRNTGGYLRSLFSGKLNEIANRTQVLMGKKIDPFDVYEWLHALHARYNQKPYYFFLVAERTGRLDKNIPGHHSAMRELIRHHVLQYPIGLHPSWRSGDEQELLQKEIRLLSNIVGQQVLCSRQHFIRFNLPDTFRLLIRHGILFDFSMGYGSINGFRASVASPYYWYDLENDEQTELMLFPFCYMDANSFFEQKLTASEALNEMREYYKAVKEIDGTLVMIWHNFILGYDEKYKGWRNIYEQFVAEVSKE